MRGDATYTACDQTFLYDVADDQPIPTCCGALHCRARSDWDDERWAGAARMAGARQAAGIDLSDIDGEALARSDR